MNEQFVKTKGEEFGTAPVFILDDNDDVDDQSVESDMEKRYLQ